MVGNLVNQHVSREELQDLPSSDKARGPSLHNPAPLINTGCGCVNAEAF
jgi:hypothetical protein